MIELPRGLAVEVTPEMREQLARYAEELRLVNSRINLVSRKDEDAIATRHIPHCLALATRRFPDDTTVCDWGTGGGLPLIPLAIVFPGVRFVGVDSVRKKTSAVETIASRIGLSNVETLHVRAEQSEVPHSVSVSRATAALDVLWKWHRRSLVPSVTSEEEWTGLVCLKGGDLQSEVDELKRRNRRVRVERFPIADLYDDPYFATKEIVHVTAIDSHG